MTGLILTGATGFLGRRIAAKAREEGRQTTLIGRDTVTIDGIDIPHGRSARTMADILGDRRDDILVHCAAFNSPTDDINDAEKLVDGNIGFGYSVLEAAHAAGCFRLLNFGTFWQFDAVGGIHPVNGYAAMKVAFQTLLDYAASAKGTSSLTLILSDIYGEDDERPKLLSLLIGQRGATEPMPMSDGQQRIAPLHVDDLLMAVFHALDMLDAPGTVPAHRIYHAMGPQTVTIREFAGMVQNALGTELWLQWGARQKLARIPDCPYVDGPRLPRWQPRISLSEGIRRVVAHATGS